MKWSLMLIRSLGFILLLLASANAAAQGTQIQGPRNAADVYSGVVYGPIDQSDTLWAISSQYRKNQQFTVYQVMLAIYELNPRAFNNRNFNTMVNGSMLQLPTDRYIARIDPQRALAKAQQDDRAFAEATGRQGNSVATESSEAQQAQTNLKPDVPLVNKEELDEAQQRFQQQINRLRNQQSQVVKQLRDQLDVSIKATQSIVDENRIVLETLAAKDEEFTTLKTELSEQFESELSQQAAEIEELKEFVRLMKLREEQSKSDAMGSLIRDPLFIIISTTVAGFLIFVLIALMLLRKPKATKTTVAETPSEVEEELVLDDAASKDADDLLELLESETVSDDDLLDDILSDELEETIDEISPDIDDFGDLEDEMLVPDQKDDNQGGSILGDDDLDIDDLDLDSLDEDLGDLESPSEEDDFSLDEDEISLDEDFENALDSSDSETNESNAVEQNTDGEPPEVDIDQMLEGGDVNITNAIDASSIDNDDLGLEEELAEPTDSEAKSIASTNLTVSEDEQDEISIDDLLEQNALDGEVPDGISLEPSGEITENVIEQIEAEISEKNIEINTLTDSLIDDIESNNYEEDDDLDFDPAEEQDRAASNATESQRSIQSIDDLTKDVEADIAEVLAESEAELDEVSDEVDVNELSDPLSDELLSELGAEMPDDDDNDIFDLSDDGLEEVDADGELEADAEEESEEIDIDSVLDDSLDDLLNNHVDDEDLDSNRDALLNEILEPDRPSPVSELPKEPSDLVEQSNEQGPAENEIESEEKEGDFDEVEDLINIDTESAKETNDLSDLTDELLTELDSEIDDSLELDSDELDDIDLSELDIELPSEPEPSEESEQASSEQSDSDESIDDSILDLPDLDDWLDDDKSELSEDAEVSENIDNADTGRSTEDDVLQEIEEADFDSLLADMGALEDDTGSKLADLELEETPETASPKVEAEPDKDLELDNPDLDLTALFDDPDGGKEPDSSFIDVDNLIEESEKLPPASDDEIELNIDMSLDSFLNDDTNIDVDMDADQASNLDLARVYIDMEDNEAATELLEEVLEKGDDEQQEEAKLLLAQLKE